MESLEVIVNWYLLTTLVSIAFTPVTLLAFRTLVDQGAAFARTCSMLVFVWPIWFLAGVIPAIVPFSEASLWSTVVVGGVGCWVLAIRRQAINRDVLLRVAIAEFGQLVLFAGYVWLRGYDPTIAGQEKMSDLMMLATTMQAASMPPNDAWLAGETINYYYVGYVPWAAVGKLLGIAPAVTYNVTLASVFASTVMVAFGVAASVIARFYSRRIAYASGIVATLFLVFMATPWAVFTAIQQRDTIWSEYWFSFMWDATRQLEGGVTPPQPAITEFPSFSFQLGDLHPHLLALPFTMLALASAWMLSVLPAGSLRGHWGRIVVAGGLTGALYGINSWDFPAYFLVAIGGMIVGTRRWPRQERLLAAALLATSSIALWLPFFLQFESPIASNGTRFASVATDIPLIGGVLASLSRWTGEPTSLGEYIGLVGFMYVASLFLIGQELWHRRDCPRDVFATRATLSTAVVLGVAGLLVPMPLLVLAGVPLILILYVWQLNSTIIATNAALAMFGMGFVLTLIPEFVYLTDVFNNRMNMVFKLYYQAWVLYALGTAIGMVILWEAVRTIPIARIVLGTTIVAMIVGGVGATAVGVNQWNTWRYPDNSEWIGMDGLFFLNEDPGWSGEYGGIAWLYTNATPDDVLLSAGGCEFTLDVGITAAGSGIPTILGWAGHEGQWHLGQAGFHEELVDRTKAINHLWETLDPVLLDQYGVTLIYIGPTESHGGAYRREEPGATCAPGPFSNATNPDFPGDGWTRVYANEGGTRIYRRDEPG